MNIRYVVTTRKNFDYIISFFILVLFLSNSSSYICFQSISVPRVASTLETGSSGNVISLSFAHLTKISGNTGPKSFFHATAHRANSHVLWYSRATGDVQEKTPDSLFSFTISGAFPNDSDMASSSRQCIIFYQ